MRNSHSDVSATSLKRSRTQGLFCHFDPEPGKSKPYFKSGWNVLDFIIVVASIVDLTPGEHGCSERQLCSRHF